MDIERGHNRTSDIMKRGRFVNMGVPKNGGGIVTYEVSGVGSYVAAPKVPLCFYDLPKSIHLVTPYLECPAKQDSMTTRCFMS
jgi:hypothetical protein